MASNLPHQRLGSFEILDRLGAGAMGEVYRARDTRLGREVAIKVLPEIFARESDRLSRFEREARVLASLNHPNIAAIHELGHEDDVHFLVLELVSGQTLDDKLKNGPLSVTETAALFTQIAASLENAHEQGIVHRDLKPANVMITDDDRVKVLDFGLAKALERPVITTSHDQTLAHDSDFAGVTGEGKILGTPAYMAPEQASGKPIDKRADIWAFGCCLYEALTGQRPFSGDSATQLMARILEREPVWETLPDATPSRIRLLVWRCLQKDPQRRLRDIGEARFELSETGSDTAFGLAAIAPPTESTSKSVSRPASGSGRRVGWALTGLAAGLLAGIAAAYIFGSSKAEPAPAVTSANRNATPSRQPAKQVVRSVYHVGDENVQSLYGLHALGFKFASIAFSPDGTRLAYVTKVEQDRTQLYFRNLHQFAGSPLPDTEGVMMPFFSPDGNTIGFFTQNELKTVSVRGGTPRTLCEARNPSGGCWATDGTIYFCEEEGVRISSIKATGGSKQLILRGTSTWLSPKLLPDEKGLLLSEVFQGNSSSFDYGRILYLELDQAEGQFQHRVLYDGGYAPECVDGEYLTFMRGDSVLAVPLDLATVEVKNRQPVVVLDGVLSQDYTISRNGHVAYVPGRDNEKSTVAWIDRGGVEEPLPIPADVYGTFDLSPDNQRLAIQVVGVRDQIYIHDVSTGRGQQLTQRGDSRYPLWAPDGKSLVFRWYENEQGGLAWKEDVTAATPHKILLPMEGSTSLAPYGFSSDGTKVLYTYPSTESGGTDDIGVLSVQAQAEPDSLITGEFNEWCPSFSPDGKWIVYCSDQDGQYQIYVRPYPLV
ncbi:MAG: protein kinase, partial [Planctomycetota bacterium]|nr:protein kinase [Planctomycetota bacterium]